MSDELADQLKAHAADQERRKLLQTEQQNLQKSREVFVYSQASHAYGDLVQFMKEEVEDTRSKTGNSPEFTVTGSYFQLGHVALYFQFDQPVVNRRNNELVLSFALAPNKHGPLSTAPIPEVHRLEAVEDWDKREILWASKPGRLKTKELAKWAIEILVDYYRRHSSR